jgi:hypothetical protein
MKIFLSILVVVVVAVAVWFAVSSRNTTDGGSVAGNLNDPGKGGASPGMEAGQSGAGQGDMPSAKSAGSEEDGDVNVDDRPATEVYKSADEALKAVKEAAADYDDLVLDQFTDLPRNCSWCDSFYSSLKDMIVSPDIKSDERSYYAELLAISGRVENVKSLVDAINGAKSPEEINLLAEALELSTGGGDVVKYLGDQLGSKNDTLREAAVAAVTNQGSRLATEILYKNTVDRGDPDGYYSMGIGLGEVVPEPEALPYLQELAMKRDQYSHLAVKSLLNAGLEGTKIVIDVLGNSKNPDFDKEMLKGAKDHVAYDDDVVNYLKNVAETSKSPRVQEFAKDVLADFAQSKEDDVAAGAADQDGDQVGGMPPQSPM